MPKGWGGLTDKAGRPSIDNTQSAKVMTALNIAHDQAITVALVLDKESGSPCTELASESTTAVFVALNISFDDISARKKGASAKLGRWSRTEN